MGRNDTTLRQWLLTEKDKDVTFDCANKDKDSNKFQMPSPGNQATTIASMAVTKKMVYCLAVNGSGASLFFVKSGDNLGRESFAQQAPGMRMSLSGATTVQFFPSDNNYIVCTTPIADPHAEFNTQKQNLQLVLLHSIPLLLPLSLLPLLCTLPAHSHGLSTLSFSIWRSQVKNGVPKAEQTISLVQLHRRAVCCSLYNQTGSFFITISVDK